VTFFGWESDHRPVGKYWQPTAGDDLKSHVRADYLTVPVHRDQLRAASSPLSVYLFSQFYPNLVITLQNLAVVIACGLCDMSVS